MGNDWDGYVKDLAQKNLQDLQQGSGMATDWIVEA